MEEKTLHDLESHLEVIKKWIRYAKIFHGKINIAQEEVSLQELKQMLTDTLIEIAKIQSNNPLKKIK